MAGFTSLRCCISRLGLGGGLRSGCRGSRRRRRSRPTGVLCCRLGRLSPGTGGSVRACSGSGGVSSGRRLRRRSRRLRQSRLPFLPRRLRRLRRSRLPFLPRPSRLRWLRRLGLFRLRLRLRRRGQWLRCVRWHRLRRRQVAGGIGLRTPRRSTPPPPYPPRLPPIPIRRLIQVTRQPLPRSGRRPPTCRTTELVGARSQTPTTAISTVTARRPRHGSGRFPDASG